VQKQTSTLSARQRLVEDGEVGSFKRAVVAATPNMYYELNLEDFFVSLLDKAHRLIVNPAGA
jgi:hypothetical protein